MTTTIIQYGGDYHGDVYRAYATTTVTVDSAGGDEGFMIDYDIEPGESENGPHEAMDRLERNRRAS